MSARTDEMASGRRVQYALDRAALARVVGGHPAKVLERARQYVAERRVIAVTPVPDGVRAVVLGTDAYDVLIRFGPGAPSSDCTCMAYQRDGLCKHVAALALTLENPPPPLSDALPDMLRHVHSAGTFLARLSLHTRTAIAQGIDRWSPLVDWWLRTSDATAPHVVALRKHVLEQAPGIERDLETLRTWEPPPCPLPETAFGDLYANLAAKYAACRGGVIVATCAPGPLEGGRHPGFVFAYDAKRSVFEARERRSPLIEAPLGLSFSLDVADRTEPRFRDGSLGGYGRADAWELFALREVLLALHARTDEAVVTLERELARPVWDHVLEQLSPRAAKAPEPREWAFCLSPTGYGDGGNAELKVTALSRARPPAGAKAAKWKKQSFEALYSEEASPFEREIARVAICTLERTGDARLTVGTPQGHELLRLLAAHPNVRLAQSSKVDPERDPPADLVVGDVRMNLERAPNGSLSPRFLVGDRELSPGMLSGPPTTGFRGATRGTMIASAFVSPSLRGWVTTAEKMGAALAFPVEAVGRLAASTAPLVAEGVAELPRDALGVECGYDPRPALRVEWHPEGAAVVQVFISVHPSAPLVAPGLGPTLYTFVHEGARVFVEREMAREVAVAKGVRERIEAPLTWDFAVGRTESLEEAIALAAWLDANPLGLVIEVTVGRSPSAIAWDEATRDLTVRREGSWLVLDGALDVAGAKLTLGDVLDAVRLARKYVRAADGLFLELSQDAIDKLRPVAIASELAEQAEGEGEGVRVHDAFAPVLLEARASFGSVRGVDLGKYAERFATRAKKVRVPSLDHGTLRPYQREGVAWMLGLATWAPGCVLADDMGLGKTVQTAAVLKARAKLGPQLIVAPASVSSNWMAELARFVPSLKASWFNDDRAIVPSDLGEGDVLVVSYGLLQRAPEAFGKQRWATLIIDEAQYVKNIAANRTDAVRSLDRDFTIALTGTPLENHLGELFSITALAFPGLLGSAALFRERFRRPIEGHRDEARLAVLSRLLAPFLLRRTRANVLRELPAREEILDYVDLAPDETKRYLALRRACEQQFAKRKKQETSAQLKIALFAALTRLRQLACDVRLVDPSFEGSATKITRTVELCTELAEEGNHALVFSQFTQFLEKIRDALVAAGLRVGYLAGDTPTTRRRAVIDAFQAGEYDVFCVSLLAGGTGLNLTRASYVIHTDPWWNPAAEEQATSRAHRMGQTDPVTVYRLVARGTIEEAVLAMHAAKRELASAVLDGKASATAISSAELLELLRFGA